MGWRLCPRVWRVLACARLPAPFKARSAIAESTGRREESLSPGQTVSFGVTLLGSKRQSETRGLRVGSFNGGRSSFCFNLERRMIDHLGISVGGIARATEFY